MLSQCYRQSHTSALNKISARLPEAREFISSFDVTLSLQLNAQNAFINRWYGNTSERKCSELTRHFNDRFVKSSEFFILLREYLLRTSFEQFNWINHFFMLLGDPYYRWAVTEFLFSRAQQGLFEIPRARFNQELKTQLPGTIGPVSLATYGRNLLAALRDNGLLEGKVKKCIAATTISYKTITFMLYSLSFLGDDRYAFQDSPLYRSFLKTPEMLSSTFITAANSGYLEYTGDRNRITFTLKYPDLKTWVAECI
jgi:hypothetical protein